MENVSSTVAFAANIQITGVDAHIYLSDNHFFLFPGEIRDVVVRLEKIKDRGRKDIMIEASGWRVKGQVKIVKRV